MGRDTTGKDAQQQGQNVDTDTLWVRQTLSDVHENLVGGAVCVPVCDMAHNAGADSTSSTDRK